MEAPEYYYYSPTTDKASAAPAACEHFIVDDLLDFSNAGAGFFDNAAANSAYSSGVVAVDSCNSSVCGDNGGNNNNHSNGGVCLDGFYGVDRSLGSDCNLSGELCVPCDDLAELEWLSNFVEDSFSQPSLFLPATAHSSKPLPPGSSTSNTPIRHNPPPPLDSSSVYLPEPSPLPSKSRSKRPRAIPCDWTTRLLHLTVSTTAEPPHRPSSSKRESGGSGSTWGPDTAPRRCLHCAAEKTPQWRTGPLGPKTLCNACGVRYKSGRLVPEYRPAGSPTFVSTKHSNSHRKVIELRRQKDLQRVHPHPHPHSHHHPQFIGSSPIFSGGDHEYLIGGPGYRHMI